jgi:hypothetical protein
MVFLPQGLLEHEPVLLVYRHHAGEPPEAPSLTAPFWETSRYSGEKVSEISLKTAP